MLKFNIHTVVRTLFLSCYGAGALLLSAQAAHLSLGFGYSAEVPGTWFENQEEVKRQFDQYRKQAPDDPKLNEYIGPIFYGVSAGEYKCSLTVMLLPSSAKATQTTAMQAFEPGNAEGYIELYEEIEAQFSGSDEVSSEIGRLKPVDDLQWPGFAFNVVNSFNNGEQSFATYYHLFSPPRPIVVAHAALNAESEKQCLKHTVPIMKSLNYKP